MKKLLSYLALLPMTIALEVGDKFCTEGFVMDFFCINRGTLFDNPGIATLEGPEQHSLHCLLDVASCINSKSHYEILIDPTDTDGDLYMRGWKLTDSSKQKMITMGRSAGEPGSCTTCKGDSTLKKGLRAVFTATVSDLNLDDPFTPPLIDVDQVQSSNGIEGSPCEKVYNKDDILDTMSSEEKKKLFSIKADDSLRVMYLAHGSMMLIGWGFLLPAGAMMARFFKHRPNGLWFKIHRSVQTVGLLFAITGWIIALANFSVFGDKGFNNYRHGIMGMVTMIMGLLQPLNAIFRPHLPKEGEEKSRKRIIWEIYHKNAGWLTIMLAAATVILGTTLLPQPKDSKAFLYSYIGGVVLLLIGLFFIKRDGRAYLL